MVAMSVKNVISSLADVWTERDGGSQLWLVNGMLVSTVIGESSIDENEWRRDRFDAAKVGEARGLMT